MTKTVMITVRPAKGGYIVSAGDGRNNEEHVFIGPDEMVRAMTAWAHSMLEGAAKALEPTVDRFKTKTDWSFVMSIDPEIKIIRDEETE